MNANDVAPVRVVFVDHSDERGGAELALIRLLSVPQSWQPIVVLPSPARGSGGGVFSDGLPPEVSVIRNGPEHAARRKTGSGALASVRLAAKILMSAVGLAMLRPVRQADVLVANTTRAGVYVSIAALLTGKPYVVHIRDVVVPEAIGSVAATLMRRLVLPRADGVVANSRLSLETVASSVRTQNVSVVPSPAGLSRVDPDSVTVGSTPLRIGMVARIDPWKGQELLLRAFAEACRDDDAVLVFYGDAAFGQEEYAAELRQLASQLGVEHRVDFAGHVSDVHGAIASLDVCVQSSIRAEPLGQNVLQYLSAGKPTIVSGEGGPLEWVTAGENGLVFEPRDQGSLAAAIRVLIADRDLRYELARNAARTPGLLTDSEVSDQVLDVVRTAAHR